MANIAETDRRFGEAAGHVRRWLKRVIDEENRYFYFGDEEIRFDTAARIILLALEKGSIFFRVRSPISGKPLETVIETRDIAIKRGGYQVSWAYPAHAIIFEVNADITPSSLNEHGLYVLAYLYNKHISIPLHRIEGDRDVQNRITADDYLITDQPITRFPL